MFRAKTGRTIFHITDPAKENFGLERRHELDPGGIMTHVSNMVHLWPGEFKIKIAERLRIENEGEFDAHDVSDADLNEAVTKGSFEVLEARELNLDEKKRFKEALGG